MDKKKPVILINGKINREVMPLLEENGGFEIRKWTGDHCMTPQELAAAITDVDVLIVSYESVVSREAIQAGNHLKLIVQPFVGYENTDIAACTELGIPFCNTSGQSITTVAEMAMTLIFASARHLTVNDRYIHSGGWSTGKKIPFFFGWDIHDSVLGIIGMGHIGLYLAKIAQGCGMKVLYHNRHQRQDDAANHMRFVSAEELYAEADVVVATLPSTAATRHSIDMTAFRQMKKSALFVNVGRGDTVQTDDLTAALQQGEIAQAAFDVVDPEPLPADHPLLHMDNVIISPHVGGSTSRAWRDKGRVTAQNIINYYSGKPLISCVNPEVLDTDRS